MTLRGPWRCCGGDRRRSCASRARSRSQRRGKTHANAATANVGPIPPRPLRLWAGAHQLVLVQADIPAVHRRHLREPGHGLPVSRHRRQRRRPRAGLGEPVVTARERKTRRHPLHVVLERPRQRLNEVIHTEQQDPLRRSEQPGIRQLRIPAQLGLQASHQRLRQVRSHDLGRAPAERERRDHHPAVPDRHQVRVAGGVLLLELGDRVRAARGAPPPGVTRYRGP